MIFFVGNAERLCFSVYKDQDQMIEKISISTQLNTPRHLLLAVGHFYYLCINGLQELLLLTYCITYDEKSEKW